MKNLKNIKKNMGTADRLIRTTAAVIIIILYLTGVIRGAWGVALLIVAGIFLITSAVGTCLIYMLLGVDTLDKKK